MHPFTDKPHSITTSSSNKKKLTTSEKTHTKYLLHTDFTAMVFSFFQIFASPRLWLFFIDTLLPWSGLLFFYFAVFFNRFFMSQENMSIVPVTKNRDEIKAFNFDVVKTHNARQRERGKKLSTINRSLESDFFSQNQFKTIQWS